MSSTSPVAVLLDSLSADRATLRAAVDAVPAALRGKRPAPDRWSVAEVLEHLSMVEGRSVQRVRALIESAPLIDGNHNGPTGINRAMLRNRAMRINAPDGIRPTGQVSSDEAWSALERSRAELVLAIDSARGRDLSKVSQTHPALGPIDGYQWIALIGGHEERHSLQIGEIAAALSGTTA